MLCFNMCFIVLLFLIEFCESVYSDDSFRCDYKYSKVAKGWFKHVVVPTTWEDARLWCVLEHTSLASPTSYAMASEMTLLMDTHFSPKSEVFTGIHSTVSPGVFHTVEGKPLSEVSAPWAENEPDIKTNENCLTFSYNGTLAARSCEEKRPFICFRPITATRINHVCGTVDPEYFFDPRTNKCYKFHTVPRNFSRSFFACSAEGGHLVIINSDTEAQVVKELYAKYPDHKMVGSFEKGYAFVGFYDWNERADWRTIHGQTLNEAGYAKFLPNEPNHMFTSEFCGTVNRDAMFNDADCLAYLPFICEKKPDYPPICENRMSHIKETNDQLEYHFFPVSSGALHFKVRAPNDAHIALTMRPQESYPMVEVFIGGWLNTKSAIRKNRTKPDKVVVETPQILNGGEFRGFWVRWGGGIISAGREGETVPFMSWRDPEPFPISFVGVRTGWGATGLWKIEGNVKWIEPDQLATVSPFNI